MIQGEQDEHYILREDFNSGIRTLAGSGLVYEILIYERHLADTIYFVDEHPDQPFVLDHVAKPLIAAGVLEPWAQRMQELGQREHVWCKLSGLVTEAKWDAWTPEALTPYLDVAVEAFGPERLMAGSDWPVCLVAERIRAVVEGAAGLLCVIQRGRAGRSLRRHGGTGLWVVVFAAAYSKQEYAGGVDLADAVVGRMEGPCTDRSWVVGFNGLVFLCSCFLCACGWATTRCQGECGSIGR